MPSLRPSWVIQQVIPPALLTYFTWAWRRCTWTIGRDYLFVGLNHRWLGALYMVATNILIPSVATIFLRLYFLPSTQSVPPCRPPADIASLKCVFECAPPPQALEDGYALVAHGSTPAPATADSLLSHCHRGRCGGRWKPARARHCSECGVCRAGFDHHCAFFANCLTAPYLPAFLALCFLTPVAVLVLASPLYCPLLFRAIAAWKESQVDPRAVAWWAWGPSWIVAGGPVGRWVAGLALGWRALDAVDGGSVAGFQRLEIACLCVVGNVLAAITLALGWSTYTHIRDGELTVDKERTRALLRTRDSIAKLVAAAQPVPPALTADLERFGPRHWFFVPTPDSSTWAGVILPTLPLQRPYDLGPEGNLDQAVSRGRGLRWLLPWVAVRAGMAQDEVLCWPLDPAVAARLAQDADEHVHAGDISNHDSSRP